MKVNLYLKLSCGLEVRDMSIVHAIFVKDSMITREKLRLGMHYAKYKPAITT